MRFKYFFDGNEDISTSHTPKQLIVKSSWTPSEQDTNLENKINEFKQTLVSLHNNHLRKTQKGSNLTNLQKSHLSKIRDDEKFIILMCDKNLGPAIIERAEYIKLVLQQHLHNTKTYTNLTENEANLQLNNL